MPACCLHPNTLMLPPILECSNVQQRQWNHTRARGKEVMSLKLPGFLKNKQSPCLFQHLKMCFVQSYQVRYCISSMLSFQRLSPLWDIDLVSSMKSPYQAITARCCAPVGPGWLMASPCTSQASYKIKCSLWCSWFWPVAQKSLRSWCAQELTSLWPQLPPFTLSAHKKDVKPNKDM